jgi:3-oxoadipate enol-lactonase
MTTLTVTAPGASLHVLDEGVASDPPILLLHAGIADSRAWDAMTPHLVAAGYRVVRYDRRGFGRTVSEDVEFSNRADALVVLDALGIGRAALVGNSQGGQIALDTAIEHPDRVAAVVAVAAGLGGFDGGATPDEMTAFERMDALEERLDAAGPAGDAEALAEVVDLDVAFWVDGPGQPSDRVRPDVRDLVRTMDAEHYDPTRVHGQPVPLRPPAGERLVELRQPVLAVAGALDASEVVATAEHLGRAAPRAKTVIWPDVAHMIGLEAPDRLAGLIVDFLAPLPRWS